MFDYVIVGAGSAGCALASRLSENPDITVCLVEAGPADTDDNLHVPLAGAKMFRSHVDWDYDTHDEPFCDGRRIYLPRGRVLGGTSAINGMVYIRGNPADYDDWQQPGWSYRELLPYFLRSEDNERGASNYHGTGGPLSVSDSRSNNPMSAAFVEAAIQAGFDANEDFNGQIQDGFGQYQLTQRDGRRCSSAVAYLHPVMSRPNLTVETHLEVHRVTFEHGRATGIIGRRLGERIELRAHREVILAAGAYNTPHLLLLSGIGPAGQLAPHGVPVVLDQPMVGQNLQDHPTVNLVYTHSQPVSLLIAGEEKYQREFVEQGTGPLTSNVPEAGGFVRSHPGLSAPDLQFHCCPLMLVDGCLGEPSAHGISYGACVITARSRGTVTLASSEPSVKPRIRHNYYSEPGDMDTAIAGLRIGLEIARQKALMPYTEKPFAVPESASDTDLRRFARQQTQTLFHPAGTCAMGTVVDTDLRVLGVDGLRIVDASVMPVLPRGNPNAPIIAMAEKAADLIGGVTPLAPALAAVTG
jgi:choline dehydrogenase